MFNRTMDAPEQQAKRMKETMVVAHIPEEIIVQILSGLPVKSLLRFKSVCKLWQSLISYPQFRLRTKGREAIIFCCAKQTDDGKRYLYSLDHQYSLEELPHPLGPRYSHHRVDFVASCKGLVLVCTSHLTYSDSDYFRFHLWNPSTRSCRPLPELTTLINDFYFPVACGLCFDESTDDYKVAMVDDLSHTGQTSIVFSLGRAIKLAEVSFPHVVSGAGVFANGNLHWMDEDEKNIDGDDLIVCFDGTTNKFGKFPTPKLVKDKCKPTFVLGVLDGCLCLSTQTGFKCEIFIMREYGLKESWTCLCTIVGRVINWVFLWGYMPLFFTKPGEEFFTSSFQRILVYNVKTKSLKEIPHQEFYTGHLSYEQSLTSVYF